MLILVKLIGVIIAAFGLAIFASPVFSQKVFNFFKEGKKLYYAAVIRGAVGLVILFTASRSQVPVAAISLGLMFLASGIVVFVGDLEKMKGFVTGFSEMPELVIRLLGLVAATFGVLVFSIY